MTRGRRFSIERRTLGACGAVAIAKTASALDVCSSPMNEENVFQKVFAAGNSYWLTRFVILRLLGFVYAVAFLVAAQQLVPLVGERGLTPANHFLASIQAQLGSQTAGMLRVPTLFWLGISDTALSIFSWIGFGLSLVVLGGYANVILLAVLWAMYMSIVHIGQIWYGYGWEIQLLETGFLSIFLCPLLDGRPFPKCRPPVLVIWLFRWLGFRIMIGAGLIKLRGDPCWRDLTCMYYHYETQPIPEPDQSLPSLCAALVPQVGDGMEPFCRTDRAVVFVWPTAGQTHRGRPACHFPNLSHHQRQSFVP